MDDTTISEAMDAELTAIFTDDTTPAAEPETEVQEDGTAAEAAGGNDPVAETQSETETQAEARAGAADGQDETQGDATQPETEPQEEVPEEAETYLSVAYGDRTGRISQADAERIGGILGMNAAQFAQVFADAGTMQQYTGAIDALRDYAAVAGMPVADIAKNLTEQLPAMEQQRVLAALQQQYPTADAAVLASIAQTQAQQNIQRAREQRQAQEAQVKTQQQQDDFQQAVNRWAEVGRLFPEIKRREDIPQEVYTACDRGGDPVTEMYRYKYSAAQKQVQELQRQLDTEKKNNANRAKATGGMGGSLPQTPKDPIAEILEG